MKWRLQGGWYGRTGSPQTLACMPGATAPILSKGPAAQPGTAQAAAVPESKRSQVPPCHAMHAMHLPHSPPPPHPNATASAASACTACAAEAPVCPPATMRGPPNTWRKGASESGREPLTLESTESGMSSLRGSTRCTNDRPNLCGRWKDEGGSWQMGECGRNAAKVGLVLLGHASANQLQLTSRSR